MIVLLLFGRIFGLGSTGGVVVGGGGGWEYPNDALRTRLREAPPPPPPPPPPPLPVGSVGSYPKLALVSDAEAFNPKEDGD